jgi:hypothetical protein
MSEVQISVVKAQDTQIVTGSAWHPRAGRTRISIGGTTNQVLVKISGANYGRHWDNLDDILNSSNGVVDEGEYL